MRTQDGRADYQIEDLVHRLEIETLNGFPVDDRHGAGCFEQGVGLGTGHKNGRFHQGLGFYEGFPFHLQIQDFLGPGGSAGGQKTRSAGRASFSVDSIETPSL
jgi:hypothetical protein